MDDKLKYMSRCLQLARIAGGRVAPNPMVGAVLVCDDLIIGEGYHEHFGEDHDARRVAVFRPRQVSIECAAAVLHQRDRLRRDHAGMIPG